MAKRITLSIDPEIVPKWGLWEALREIVQGAIDAGTEYTIKYDEEEEKLVISNPGQLSKASLLIGHSTKRDDVTKIGQHGEGYKLAAAVLLRLGKPFSIYNDKEIWTFSKVYDKRFGSETIRLSSKSWMVPKSGTILWEVGGISPPAYQMFMDNLQVEGDIQVENGWILLDKPGQIFSGGLLVCNISKLTYGYNFNPGVLNLHRDRNLVSDFDVLWETSIAWRYQPDTSTLLHNGVEDVKYIAALSNNAIADEAFKLFRNLYGDKANPCSDELHKREGVDNVIVPTAFRDTIVKSSLYTALGGYHHKEPRQQLKEWYEGAKVKYSFTDADFEKILDKAKKWRTGL